jgi:dolichol-phosphate mannosyltransferase
MAELLSQALPAPASDLPPAPAPELTVVIPCYNERRNVAPLAARLAAALDGIAWEAVFVDDDSPDGTAAEVRRLARADPRIRCIRRIGRRGLASAVIEGALSSSADLIAVMDGDLQHDETRLPEMRARLRDGGCDLVVGSRHVGDADAAGLGSPWRHRISSLGIRLAQAASGAALSDPMSGFFLLERTSFERLAPRLTGQGFKILLDVLLSAPAPLRVCEVPASLHTRGAGESKLDIQVIVQFGALLLDKALGGLLPLRFVSFALVGGFGVLVNLAFLQAGRTAGLDFGASQLLGTVVATIANFQLNNAITYRDQRLRGAALWRGLVVFAAVCGVGVIANVGIAQTLYREHFGWTPAGAVGAAIGVVWNYAVSATLVWRRR